MCTYVCIGDFIHKSLFTHCYYTRIYTCNYLAINNIREHFTSFLGVINKITFGAYLICGTHLNFSGDPYYKPLMLSTSDLGSKEIRSVLTIGLANISATNMLILMHR